MKDTLIGFAIGAIIAAVGWLLLYPYYSLANLKNIAEELEKIRKIIENEKVTK